MPQPKKAAAATKPRPAKSNGSGPRKVSRAEAQKAIADLKDKPRNGEFRGVKFELPSTLPASFVFDVGEMMDDGGIDFGLVHRLMTGVLGAETWRQIRDKIAADNTGFDQMDDLLVELFDAITQPYGISLGESSASTDS